MAQGVKAGPSRRTNSWCWHDKSSDQECWYEVCLSQLRKIGDRIEEPSKLTKHANEETPDVGQFVE
jgi:hypothetical protein